MAGQSQFKSPNSAQYLIQKHDNDSENNDFGVAGRGKRKRDDYLKGDLDGGGPSKLSRAPLGGLKNNGESSKGAGEKGAQANHRTLPAVFGFSAAILSSGSRPSPLGAFPPLYGSLPGRAMNRNVRRSAHRASKKQDARNSRALSQDRLTLKNYFAAQPKANHRADDEEVVVLGVPPPSKAEHEARLRALTDKHKADQRDDDEEEQAAGPGTSQPSRAEPEAQLRALVDKYQADKRAEEEAVVQDVPPPERKNRIEARLRALVSKPKADQSHSDEEVAGLGVPPPTKAEHEARLLAPVNKHKGPVSKGDEGNIVMNNRQAPSSSHTKGVAASGLDKSDEDLFNHFKMKLPPKPTTTVVKYLPSDSRASLHQPGPGKARPGNGYRPSDAAARPGPSFRTSAAPAKPAPPASRLPIRDSPLRPPPLGHNNGQADNGDTIPVRSRAPPAAAPVPRRTPAVAAPRRAAVTPLTAPPAAAAAPPARAPGQGGLIPAIRAADAFPDLQPVRTYTVFKQEQQAQTPSLDRGNLYATVREVRMRSHASLADANRHAEDTMARNDARVRAAVRSKEWLAVEGGPGEGATFRGETVFATGERHVFLVREELVALVDLPAVLATRNGRRHAPEPVLLDKERAGVYRMRYDVFSMRVYPGRAGGDVAGGSAAKSVAATAPVERTVAFEEEEAGAGVNEEGHVPSGRASPMANDNNPDDDSNSSSSNTDSSTDNDNDNANASDPDKSIASDPDKSIASDADSSAASAAAAPRGPAAAAAAAATQRLRSATHQAGSHGGHTCFRQANRAALSVFLSLARPANARVEDNLHYQYHVRPEYESSFEQSGAAAGAPGGGGGGDVGLVEIEWAPPGEPYRWPFVMLKVWVEETTLRGPVDFGGMIVGSKEALLEESDGEGEGAGAGRDAEEGSDEEVSSEE